VTWAAPPVMLWPISIKHSGAKVDSLSPPISTNDPATNAPAAAISARVLAVSLGLHRQCGRRDVCVFDDFVDACTYAARCYEASDADYPINQLDATAAANATGAFAGY